MKSRLFEEIGGYPTLERVHKIFYDKIYAHPWLKEFFKNNNQQAIEKRQTSFMAEKMGGPDKYLGKEPKMAHRAMYITEELFEARAGLLRQSLEEFGLAKHLIERWMRIDEAFRRQIVKSSIADFYRTTWQYEKRIIVPKPKDEQ